MVSQARSDDVRFRKSGLRDLGSMGGGGWERSRDESQSPSCTPQTVYLAVTDPGRSRKLGLLPGRRPSACGGADGAAESVWTWGQEPLTRPWAHHLWEGG